MSSPSSAPPRLPANGSEYSATLLGLSAMFYFLTSLFVAMRFMSRRIRKQSLGWDDFLILPALIVTYAQITSVVLSVVFGGISFHINQLAPANLTALFQLLAAQQFLFGTSLGFAKCSIVALQMRIFVDRSFKKLAWAVLAYQIAWTISVILIGAFLCRPFAYNWDKSIPGGQCGTNTAAYVAIAATDLIGDGMIVALPLPVIWRLHVSTAKKVSFSLVLGLGFLDMIVGILRIVYLLRLDFSGDFTYEATLAYVWSLVEPSLAVMVACSATIHPVISALRDFFLRRSASIAHAVYPSTRSKTKEKEYPLEGWEHPSNPVSGGAGSSTAEAKGGPGELTKLYREYLDDDFETIHVRKDIMVSQSPDTRV